MPSDVEVHPAKKPRRDAKRVERLELSPDVPLGDISDVPSKQLSSHVRFCIDYGERTPPPPSGAGRFAPLLLRHAWTAALAPARSIFSAFHPSFLQRQRTRTASGASRRTTRPWSSG